MPKSADCKIAAAVTGFYISEGAGWVAEVVCSLLFFDWLNKYF